MLLLAKCKSGEAEEKESSSELQHLDITRWAAREEYQSLQNKRSYIFTFYLHYGGSLL